MQVLDGGYDETDLAALELFYFARSVIGCVYGSTDPDVDIPRLIDAWRDGSIDLDALVTDRTDLTGVDAAFDRMEAS